MNVRKRISLDGPWQFQTDPSGQAKLDDITLWRTVQVPLPWQAQFEDLREQAGIAWYRRTFQMPPDWAGQSVTLHFGAVDYHAQVWLNGTLLGEHAGGYLPFEFEIGGQLPDNGLSELVVRVTGPTDDPQRYPEFSFSEIPHGKQSWYGPLNGLWQSVWLECRSLLHVRAMRLLPDLSSGCVQAHLMLSAVVNEHHLVLANIVDPHGVTVASNEVPIELGVQTVNLTLGVANPLAWSPDQPHLYGCEVRLLRQGDTLDAAAKSFGFRTIEAREGRLYLNGEPIYLRGALDQDYYPDTISTPPSEAFLEDQLRKAKEMGLNCLRCHIKVADPRYYEAADRLGMLIWTELPNWRLLTKQSARRGRAILQGIVERDGHHPSIIVWTIINEDWGTDLVHEAGDRAWLKETYHWLKELDPTRLVVDNSPCWPNFHVQTDLDDYHYYRAIPDHRRQWDEFVATFAARPAWTFSSYGDAVRTGNEPLIVSEFGNWGLPDVDLLLDAQGHEPWWFETGNEWGRGVVYPHGVRRRFHLWHLDRVFGTWRAFVEATQWQQWAALKYQIEAIRRQPEIAGYVITELTDVHWECNGLLDMNRNPKVFQTYLTTFNADTVVIPAWERVAYWAGEPIRVELMVAHGAGSVLQGTELHWSLSSGAAAGQVTVPPVRAGQVQTVGTASLAAPAVTAPTLQQLNLELYSAAGDRLASNHLPLTIFPPRTGPIDPAALLGTPDPVLAERLAALGYNVTSNLHAAHALVAHKLDEEFITYMRGGKPLLLLADRPDAIGSRFPDWQTMNPQNLLEENNLKVVSSHLPEVQPTVQEDTLWDGDLDAIGSRLPGVQVKARRSTAWSGDWASSFAWLRRQGPFARLPGGPLLDHSFDRVIPTCVLAGFRPADFEAKVHAGLCVGWIHQAVALIAERRYGKGRVVLSTFRLTADAPGADPTATTLLDALIELSLS